MKKRGGWLDRLSAIASGKKVQTYCCNNKTSSGSVLGGDNVGTDCYASSTGMCNLSQNKFRCFDSKGEATMSEIREGRTPQGGRYEGSCQHISSIGSKVGRTAAAPVKAGLSAVAYAPELALSALNAGGSKKRRSRKTKITRSKRGGAKEIEICPICLEELKKGEQIPKLKCKHKFHKSCLEPVCRQKGNVGVRCPLCRGDISFSCVADITRASPWEYNPYTSHTPFNSIQLRNMTDEERDQAYMEIQRHRRNWLARRRRTIRNETPEQRDMRVESESRHSAEMRAERDRYYRNLSQPNVANEPVIHDSPHTPDYPPPDSLA
jgi:hypothetical protein